MRVPAALIFSLLISAPIYFFGAGPVHAAANDGTFQVASLTESQRYNFARDFVNKMKSGFQRADKLVSAPKPSQAQEIKDRGFVEGEELIFQLRLRQPPALQIDQPILARIHNDQILFSLSDFIYGLQFVIDLDPAAGTAQGWYIRENKPFTMNINEGFVETDQGRFTIPADTIVTENDVFVPSADLAQWFGMDLDMELGKLFAWVDSPVLLPMQEKDKRRARELKQRDRGAPQLPLAEVDTPLIGVPFVDVSTNTSYRRDGDTGEGTTNYNSYIKTTGDFAAGTLTTQTQLTKQDKLSSVRVNYKQESPNADLLGPLKARQFEVGDILTTDMPILSSNGQELGARVTNATRRGGTLRPTIDITGESIPGWDVELYRDNGLVAFQPASDEGIYLFDDVELFGNQNEFRVVSYGPQGEVREEIVSIPVDARRLAETGGQYDVSVSLEDTQTYRALDSSNDAKGEVNIAALYEHALGDRSAVSVGLQSGPVRQKDPDGGLIASDIEYERRTHLTTGFSTSLIGTLFNLDTAVDDQGELATQLVARREVGAHQLRNAMTWTTDGFTLAGGNIHDEGFTNEFTASGPLPIALGRAPRYTVATNYRENTEGEKTVDASLGYNTAFKNLSFGQNITYINGDAIPDDEVNMQTSVNGRIGPTRLRLTAENEFKPETKLERVVASAQRRLKPGLELQTSLERQIDPGLTRVSGQLNWQAGFALITPRISYNSRGDFEALLSTRFGLARDPKGGIKSFDRFISSNGGLSVFVFLDENGDGIFNEGEQPIEGATVKAPQSSINEETDENGMAFISRMMAMRQTDIYIDPDSLGDPFWIPGFQGVSVIPREGYVAELDFPVHIAGEADGTVYVRKGGNDPVPAGNILVGLYDMNGRQVMETEAGPDGFFLFSPIPPGRYYIVPDAQDLRKAGYASGPPQPIEIGYEGTILYAQNVHLTEGTNIEVAFNRDFTPYLSANLSPEQMSALSQAPVMLNLGSFKSRLMMSVRWYMAKKRYGAALAGLTPAVMPSDSQPGVKDGLHHLLLPVPSGNPTEAYQRCQKITAHGTPCGVDLRMAPDAAPAKPMKLSAL